MDHRQRPHAGFYAPGERRCFDDWCVAALSVTAASPSAPGSRTWIATVEVSSVARGIRQRARDAQAELEDDHGQRYRPDAPRPLSDELGPGESLRVLLTFRLPAGARPAGLVVHHGDFPGALIIGADQSFLSFGGTSIGSFYTADSMNWTLVSSDFVPSAASGW